MNTALKQLADLCAQTAGHTLRITFEIDGEILRCRIYHQGEGVVLYNTTCMTTGKEVKTLVGDVFNAYVKETQKIG